MTSTLQPVLRKLTVLDVPAALQLSTEAGWNQTAADWQMLIALFPDGCFGIEIDGELAATTTLICYSRRLAWIGMVLTRKSFQGRGFAKCLLSEALRRADELGIKTVKLDATQEGQPIYEKLGFRAEQFVERWERPGSVVPSRLPLASETLNEEIFSFDESAFGVDRSALLRGLTRRGSSFVASDGFLLTRPGKVRNFLGPCIASTGEAAHALVHRALAENGGWYWDLLLKNENALAIASEFGFTPKRRLLRMVRGKDMSINTANIYALAGFEFG
jgi:GNAT superfamily N-acetyltransferase